MSQSTHPISVPESVLNGIKIIQKSGLTNMLDRPMVIDLAQQFGLREAARWISLNSNLYADGIFEGFIGAG